MIKASHLEKDYERGAEKVRALNNVSLEIGQGEFVAFIGPSGSGKTTLINILGCLDNPSAGTLTIAQRVIFEPGKYLSEQALTRIRREFFGYIFQNFYLLPTLTVLENVLLPRVFYRPADAKITAKNILTELGLAKRFNHLPHQLSGGEMQRVAIARALINEPPIILADEPTGNLDTNKSNEVGQLLKLINKNEQKTIIMVTHNEKLAQIADRVIVLRDGSIIK